MPGSPAAAVCCCIPERWEPLDCCFDPPDEAFELGRDARVRCFDDWLERPADDLDLLPPDDFALLPPRLDAEDPLARLVVFLLVPLERLALVLFFLPPPLLLDLPEPDFPADDFFFAGIYSSSGECSRCTEDLSVSARRRVIASPSGNDKKQAEKLASITQHGACFRPRITSSDQALVLDGNNLGGPAGRPRAHRLYLVTPVPEPVEDFRTKAVLQAHR